MSRGAAFDVQAVCAGFVYALAIADNFLKLGQADKAIVIGAETFSLLLNCDDRSTAVLFGDGAGSLGLGSQPTGHANRKARATRSTHIHSYARQHDCLYVDGRPPT